MFSVDSDDSIILEIILFRTLFCFLTFIALLTLLEPPTIDALKFTGSPDSKEVPEVWIPYKESKCRASETL